MSKVIVVGGGAAGMMAAISAAQQGHKVLLLEKNEKLGKKLYITGKGRCNLLNACEREDFFQNVLRNPKFMYSSFYDFDNWQALDFFERNGLPTKIERGERVFPVSDHSSDVIQTLRRVMIKNKVEILLNTEVKELLLEDNCDGGQVSGLPYRSTPRSGMAQETANHISGVKCKDGRQHRADAVIIATGGISYSTTGSTGDGYRFAKEAGLKVMGQAPSLVPMDAKEGWVKSLQGLSLKNVTVRIRKDQKLLYEAFGEMLFTHFGVSGPLILSASGVVNDYRGKMPLKMEIDLKPALTHEQLDKRILRDFEAGLQKSFKNAITKLFPSKLIPVMVELSGIPGEKKVNEITKQERLAFGTLIKNLPFTLTAFRDFKEAIITRGGVAVSEINPSTMESKKVKGLYFVGEVLDVDALTGGFNLQIAWSTGHLAGASIPQS